MIPPQHGEEGKLRLLDLFAGQGGAAVGYAQAGFEVVGVDHVAQPRYPFTFIQDDALRFLAELICMRPPELQFDAIHASPPCQAYSIATSDRTIHVALIPGVREFLKATGLPYVIENVPGAPLIDPVTICGSSLGLKVRRHRLFETNWPLMVPPCAHGQQGQPVGVYGEGTGKSQKRGRKVMSSAEALEVMEMPWADRKGATQAVPPSYTELVGHQLLQHLKATVAA